MHISTYSKVFFAKSARSAGQALLGALSFAALLHSAPLYAADSAPAAAPNPADSKEWVVFNGKTASPYVMFLGSPTNWAYPLPDGENLNIGSIRAETTQINAPGDGRKVSWNGGIGQLYVQAKTTQDLADWLDEDSALVFDTVVHSAPQDSVTIRVDCRYPCLGVIEAQEIFKSLPLNQKSTVKIPLSCFAKTGAKFTSVNTPFLFYSTTRFSISLANVRYVRGAAKDADARKACA